MKLKTYIETEELTEAAFARKIGVSQVAVNRYCAGHRLPGRSVMQKIAAETNGAVTPNDFFDVEAA